MRIDIHTHVLGNCKDFMKVCDKNHDVYYNINDNPKDAPNFLIKNIVSHTIENYMEKFGAKFKNHEITSDEYFKIIYKMFSEAKYLDGLVLLALDANYHFDTGTPQVRDTDLFITNKYLFEKVNDLNKQLIVDGFKNKRFYYGASVNPNRIDWSDELNYVINETDAVLIKWIPSVQDIKLENPELIKFYEVLATNNMPLLCHVGLELAFAGGIPNRDKDDFRLLEYPLRSGVKVIAAHCASPLLPGREEEVKHFINFMSEWNKSEIKLWADTSALMMSSRLGYIKHYIKELKPEWLVHGSDFPVPSEKWMHVPYITHDITYHEYADILKEENPFDLDIIMKKAHDFDTSILKNANNILRIRNI